MNSSCSRLVMPNRVLSAMLLIHPTIASSLYEGFQKYFLKILFNRLFLSFKNTFYTKLIPQLKASITSATRATPNKKKYEKALILGFDVQACRPIAGISLLVLVRVQAGIMCASRELLPAHGASKHVLRTST